MSTTTSGGANPTTDMSADLIAELAELRIAIEEYDSHASAWNAGSNAAANRQPRSDCPYEDASELAALWRTGYSAEGWLPGGILANEAETERAVELSALRAEIERLTPRWQEGQPPEGAVLREGEPHPVHVEGHGRWFRFHDLNGRPWGTARWATIPRPS